MGASQTKDFDSAELEIEILKKLHQNLIAQNDRSKAIQVKQVEIQIKTAQAWLNLRMNNSETAFELMQEAVAIERKTSKHPITPGDVLPAIELLGDMLLEVGKNNEALVAYLENLITHPNRFNGIYGAAVAAKRSGDHEEATSYYYSLLELASDINSDKIELEEAREFIEKKVI